MIPGSRRAAAMWFSASRSCTSSRWHRSQKDRNGFQTARASHTLIRGDGGLNERWLEHGGGFPKACSNFWPELALARLPEYAWGALRKRMSRSFLQHTNAIACIDFPTGHPAQGCTDPREPQIFHAHHTLVAASRLQHLLCTCTMCCMRLSFLCLSAAVSQLDA